MAQRKPQRSVSIPNNDRHVAPELFAQTRAAAERWDDARERALAHVAPLHVSSLRYPEWEFAYLPGHEGKLGASALVGRGLPEDRPFSDQDLEDLVAWVDDAGWLDTYYLEPSFPSSRIDSLIELVANVGDIRPSEPLGHSFPPGNIFLADLLVQLQLFRRSFSLAQAIQRVDFGSLHELLQQMAGRRPWIEPVGGADLLRRARDWALGNALVTGILVLPKDDSAASPFELLVPPATPCQVVMVAFAISIGAITSPAPAPYVCEHHTCGKVFVTAKHFVRGTHRFCSPRCSKRFWSVRNTNAKRAAARAAREVDHGEEAPER